MPNENSIRQHAIEKGLRVGTVYNRIHRLGWTLDEALETPSGRTPEQEEITRKAKEVGISPTLVQRRLATGKWSLEKALSVKPGGSDIYNKYNYQGQQLTTVELEQMSGIPRAIISHRINSLHWNVERAVKMPVCNRSDRRIKKYRQSWFRIEVTIRDALNNPVRKLYNADAICPVCSNNLEIKMQQDEVLSLECAQCHFMTMLSHQSVGVSPVIYASKDRGEASDT